MRLPFSIDLRRAQQTIKWSGRTQVQRFVQYWTLLNHRAPSGKIPFIHYCTDIDNANAGLNELQGEVLGFDIEWPINAWQSQQNPTASPTSLIQLCDSERIVLVHVAKMGGECPAKLRDIMKNDKILKCGTAIRRDCRRLFKDFQISSKALIELSEATKIADPLSWPGGERLISLADLTAAYLGKSLYKGNVRVSDWSKILSFPQQLYAANDAMTGYLIYHELDRYRAKLPMPAPSFRRLLDAPAVRIWEEQMAKLDAEPYSEIEQTNEADIVD